MTPIERGQLGVMRVHAAIFAAFALGAAFAADTVLASETAVPRWLVLGVVALLLLWPVVFAPARSWRAWGYHAGDRELRLRRGVLTNVQTVVPFGRVQHIDVAQGPIERGFGVCRLMLHTAGTAHSLVTLPGLTRATAEALRDEIRAHIRQEAA